jgi:hypothetical protein
VTAGAVSAPAGYRAGRTATVTRALVPAPVATVGAFAVPPNSKCGPGFLRGVRAHLGEPIAKPFVDGYAVGGQWACRILVVARWP